MNLKIIKVILFSLGLFGCASSYKCSKKQAIILKDTSSMNSIFICFETTLQGKYQKFIFPNGELKYQVCSKDAIIKCSSPKSYENFIFSCIQENDFSKLKEQPFLKAGIIQLDPFVLQKRNKGKNKFINFFFKKGMLVEEYVEYRESIIWCLWEWCIHTRIDDYTGNLIIIHVDKEFEEIINLGSEDF